RQNRGKIDVFGLPSSRKSRGRFAMAPRSHRSWQSWRPGSVLDAIVEERRSARPGCKKNQESHLGPSVTLAKRMNRVQFCEEVRCLGQEFFRRKAGLEFRFFQPAEQFVHLTRDVGRIAEHTS